MIGCLVFGFSAWAKSDLSLNVSDISFSKNEPLVGEKVRIFARVFNLGDEDVYGFVVFSMDSLAIGEPQPVSVKVGTYDDVFLDWVCEQGKFNVQAKIVATHPADEDAANDLAAHENYFVDSDADTDGIGNSQDNDNDNDGLTDDKEKSLGTDPFHPDSDGDEISDSQDIFPSDTTEWEDTDSDGSGDNLDADDDNDGLSDEEELVLGTSPLKTDTDGDLIPDKIEIKTGFLKPNRNEWKAAGLGLASMAEAVKLAVASGNSLIGQLFAAFGFLSIFWLILRFVGQRKS